MRGSVAYACGRGRAGRRARALAAHLGVTTKPSPGSSAPESCYRCPPARSPRSPAHEAPHTGSSNAPRLAGIKSGFRGSLTLEPESPTSRCPQQLRSVTAAGRLGLEKAPGWAGRGPMSANPVSAVGRQGAQAPAAVPLKAPRRTLPLGPGLSSTCPFSRTLPSPTSRPGGRGSPGCARFRACSLAARTAQPRSTRLRLRGGSVGRGAAAPVRGFVSKFPLQPHPAREEGGGGWLWRMTLSALPS